MKVNLPFFTDVKMVKNGELAPLSVLWWGDGGCGGNDADDAGKGVKVAEGSGCQLNILSPELLSPELQDLI